MPSIGLKTPDVDLGTHEGCKRFGRICRSFLAGQGGIPETPDEHYFRGGCEFFGLDPVDWTDEVCKSYTEGWREAD